MPRTSTEDWTAIEGSWEPDDETRPHDYWHKGLRGASRPGALLLLAKRVARRHTSPALQHTIWTCPYCQWYATHQGKVRRIHIQQQFTQLATTWKQETGHLSNVTTRAMHPAYQRIIGMGRAAVPLILEELRKGILDDWFWTLYAITGENPITEEMAGDMEKMAEAWLQWGRANGYLIDLIQHLRPNSQT